MDRVIIYDKAYLFIGIFVAVCILVIVAILIDLWDALYTAKSTGERVRSRKLRITMNKVGEYWRYIFLGFLLDCLCCCFSFYSLPFMAILFGVGLIVVEAKSMFEHSRRRKSHTANLPDLLKKIISASTSQEAEKILKNITEYINDKEKETI